MNTHALALDLQLLSVAQAYEVAIAERFFNADNVAQIDDMLAAGAKKQTAR